MRDDYHTCMFWWKGTVYQFIFVVLNFRDFCISCASLEKCCDSTPLYVSFVKIIFHESLILIKCENLVPRK